MKINLPKPAKVNVPVLLASCTKYGIELAIGASTQEAVEKLSEAMNNEDTTIASCDICGGDSDNSLETCPFCGDVDVEGAETNEQPTITNEVSEMAAKKTAKKTTKKTAKKVAKKTATKKAPAKATTKKATAKKTTAKKSTAKKATTKKATAKKAAAKKAPAKKATTKKAPAKAAPSKAVEKVEVLPTLSKELTKAMDNVRRLQHNMVENLWELGQSLREIYEKKLYTQMKGPDGKPVYTDWSKFTRKEFGISSHYAFQLMDVALNFDKKKVEEVGVTKLNLLVRVPASQRDELLAKAKDTPRSKLAKEVREIVANKGPRETGRKKFTGTPGKGRGASKSTKITVMRSEPRIVVELFKRGTTERARTVEDAMGTEDCANDVKVQYMLQKDEQGLSLVIETRRG